MCLKFYKPTSPNVKARAKSGCGILHRVTSKNQFSSNWWSFLIHNNIKTELFNFLAEKITQIEPEKEVIVTKEEKVPCNPDSNLAGVAPCRHEKTDTKKFVHSGDVAKNKQTKKQVLMIKSQ